MATTELLKHNLAIEPDLQHFIGFALNAARSLGGNPFIASVACLELSSSLRRAGAGSGYPLPVRLLLHGSRLAVEWGEDGEASVLDLDKPPRSDVVEQLRLHLQRSTDASDPALLLRRNAEMMRFLNETRERTEKEIEAMQQTLKARQEELHESIRQAETDALTGLLNRRAYDEKLEQAFRRTVRQTNESLALTLFDLDFFKEINDEFGHQYGDAYLNKMAHAMRSVIRQEVDFAFRFGGDEFAILLFADRGTAVQKALDVLAAMNGRVSIGIACLTPGGPRDGDLQGFIHRADDALYEAKRAGRGRVVMESRGEDGNIRWQHFLPQTAEQAAAS